MVWSLALYGIRILTKQVPDSGHSVLTLSVLLDLPNILMHEQCPKMKQYL